MCWRNARRGVERDSSPDRISIRLGNAVAPQEITRGVRTVDFEALILAAVTRHQADVVKHRTGIEKLPIELQAAMDAGQRAEVIELGSNG